jgi:hypothetical protein
MDPLKVLSARARQTEKECDIAVLALVCWAVHRQDTLLGQKIIQHRENRFFDFPSVI